MRFSLCCALMTVALATPALAKLPPLNDEAKAKAAETAAKAAWADKVGLYKHCLVTDRIGNAYRKTGAAAPVAAATAAAALAPVATPTTGGSTVPSAAVAAAAPAAVVIPPCADPGPFVAPVATVDAAKPTSAAELSANPKATPVTAVKDKPLEASEAHSPPGTAVSPPSTKANANELGTGKPSR